MQYFVRAIGTIGTIATISALIGGCGSRSATLYEVKRPQFSEQRLFVQGAPAVDPATSAPLQFIHVNVASTSNGDGTYQNPFNSLDAALAVANSGSIVYVRGRAGSALTGFTVPAGVHVLSSGPVQNINVQGQGNIRLPLSGSGLLPVVTGTVALGSNSALSGFDITTGTGAGIDASNVTGSLDIANNVVHRAGAGSSGILVTSSTGATTVRLADNSVSGGQDSGIQIKSDGTAQITATVSGNNVSDNVGAGIFFYLLHGRVSATISNNNTQRNQARVPQEGGVRFGVFNDASGTVVLTGNNSTDNIGNGLFVGSEGTSQVTATFTGNNANGNTGNGIFLGANENASATGTITDNRASNNRVNTVFDPFPGGNGIFAGSQVNGQALVTIRNNVTSDNGNIGIFCFVANNGKGNLTVMNNTSTGSTRNGIEVNVGLNGAPGVPASPGDQPQATAVVSNNTITGNLGIGPPLGGGGLFILGFNRATVRATCQSNIIQGNAQGTGAFGGMAVVAVQSAKILATVQSNTFTGNAGANPAFTALAGVPPDVLGGTLTGPSTIDLRLTNNTADSGYALVRSPGTELAAQTIGNVGPVIVPALPIDPPGNSPFPQ